MGYKEFRRMTLLVFVATVLLVRNVQCQGPVPVGGVSPQYTSRCNENSVTFQNYTSECIDARSDCDEDNGCWFDCQGGCHTRNGNPAAYRSCSCTAEKAMTHDSGKTPYKRVGHVCYGYNAMQQWSTLMYDACLVCGGNATVCETTTANPTSSSRTDDTNGSPIAQLSFALTLIACLVWV